MTGLKKPLCLKWICPFTRFIATNTTAKKTRASRYSFLLMAHLKLLL